tara:strand:+ start:1010 stop:1558 length:549 start_codon:yes stop_codon:yes gene_type:complete
MAEPSAVYQGNTPTPIENTGLNPIQLALANYMAVGSPPPFAVNQPFLDAVSEFTDSGVLSPFTLDPRTGLPRIPDLNYTASQGIAYISKGEDIYLLRRAQDCGPDEYRFEELYIGRRPDVAEGTWAFYGKPIRSGSVTTQSSYAGGDGGYGFAPAAPVGTYGTAPPGQDVGSTQADGGGYFE